MEALFREILVAPQPLQPPQDAEAVAAAAAQVMTGFDADAVCVRDDEDIERKKESGHLKEEVTKKVLEEQRPQQQQDYEMKKILDEIICMTSDEEASVVSPCVPFDYNYYSLDHRSALGLDIGLDGDLGLDMDFEIDGWDVTAVNSATYSVSDVGVGVF